MLVEFRVQNFRSIQSDQVFTFSSGLSKTSDDDRSRKIRGYSGKLLTVAAIYGANASGKTNLLRAFHFMRNAVLNSFRFWQPDGPVPRETFAWSNGTKVPSVFEAVIVIDGVRYQYGFALSDTAVVEEWLWAWPKGKKQTWFRRKRDEYEFGENFKGDNALLKKVTRKNCLLLSSAAQHGNTTLRDLFSWFSQTEFVNLLSSRYLFPKHSMLRGFSSRHRQPLLFDDFQSDKSVIELLRLADVGISNIKIEDDIEDEDGRVKRGRVFFQHTNEDKYDTWLPLEEESSGTQTLYDLARPLMSTLQIGGLLVIDELEASLHPLLAMRLIELFNSPESNPQNAQLLFSTHDTNLLGKFSGTTPLRRDQVWLTEKDKNGATNLYPLTEYSPRKDENIELGYLQGRYGAIPFLGDFNKLASESE